MNTFKFSILASLFCLGACGDDAGIGDGGGADVDAAMGQVDASSNPNLPDAMPPLMLYTELWYSVDDRLVRIVLDTNDGSVVEFQQTTVAGLRLGQNAITMLDDGSILGARLDDTDNLTYLYHIASPPRDGGTVTPTLLGVMADNLRLEGLYTDCDGRVYAMDTGSDNTNSDGNRLLYFTGNPLLSDFSYQVVSDLSSASVADIDDMGPAIVGNEIVDNPGLAIDSGTVYGFDYQTGTGTVSGTGGTWGIHALGKQLFTDDIARLYVFNKDGELFEMDPITSTLSGVLGTGPTDVDGSVGWSGLAGPLTECDSGFEID